MTVVYAVVLGRFSPFEIVPGPASVTLRSLSRTLLAQGIVKDTLDELLRLNSGVTGDQVLAEYDPDPNFPFQPSVNVWIWAGGEGGDGGGSSSGTPEPALRLGQRNDGLGPVGHPRLRTSTSAPSSVQLGASPRVGNANRYR